MKFCGNSFLSIYQELIFPSKGGLSPSKRGQKPSFEGKKGVSRQMYNTKTSRPSFLLVSVGKIPGKYQPIPNRNTGSGYNSRYFGV